MAEDRDAPAALGREDRTERLTQRLGQRRLAALDTPLEARRPLLRRPRTDPEVVGRVAERTARFMGTGRFLIYMTVVVVSWLVWNSSVPEGLRFDSQALGFTLLTLLLSLQASYGTPLILLAQNRQADRDRVASEQDRVRAERNLADTEYLAREVAALRIALGEVATRDFVRSELRALLEELDARDGAAAPEPRGGDAGEPDGARGPRPSLPGLQVDG